MQNANKKKYNLKYRYGITIENYNDIVKKQDNRCAICAIDVEKLFVDHCHETLVCRGLLCRSCNLLLGYAYDNIETLKQAIKYLKKV